MTGGQIRESVTSRLLKHSRVNEDGCWVWTACVRKSGYSAIGVPGKRGAHPGHRVSYETFVGPIPEGLHIDHLCRNRACINPAHLEPVTQAENIRRGVSPTAVNARKTHCIHGHPLAGSNVKVRPNGCRVCLACKAISNSKRDRSKATLRALRDGAA